MLPGVLRMKLRSISLSTILVLAAPFALAQLAPLGGGSSTPPPPADQQPGGLAPLKPSTASPVSGLGIETANNDLKTARAANQEKRFADAETLMLKDTAARPNLPYLWIELGNAQIGLKKYDDAEVSFKAALSGGETVQKQAPASGGFYNADGRGTAAHVAISTAPTATDNKSKPEVEGISYSSLGEIYIHTDHVPEAQAAFDKAAAA